MMHYFIFPIGDWSFDGHSCLAKFLVKSNFSLQALREVHFKENEFIGSLCEDHEDNQISVFKLYDFFENYISSDEAKKIIQQFVDDGFELTDDEAFFAKMRNTNKNREIVLSFEESLENEQFLIISSPKEMLKIWLTCLKVIDKSLDLEISSEAMSSCFIKYKGYPHQPEDSIHFYGYDSQGRHLKTPGYGIWANYEGEFYNFCN